MTRPLPLRPAIEHAPRPCTVLDVVDDASAAVLESLTSRTSRTILAALADEPATASDLVDHVDTSLQNVHYHLGNLEEAGIVSAVGTWYSARGTEMTVYGLACERFELRIAGEAARTEAAGDPQAEEPTSPPPVPTGGD